MANDETVDILLFGLGAIGSFYAFILNRAPEVRVTVVARSSYEAVRTNGMRIESENYGEHVVRPYRVFRTPLEAAGRYEFVVCTAKAIDQGGIVRQLEPVVDNDTTIVIIQNGVGNEDPFREAYPKCTILTCVTWVYATQISPGIVHHYKPENTEIGLFPNALLPIHVEDARLNLFTSLLLAGGTPFTITPNIQLLRWEKVVWNVAWNSLTSLSMLDTQSWLQSSEHSLPLTRRVMREVVDVGRACGVDIKYELIDILISKAQSLPGIVSSMLTDARCGRQMEVEVIVGTPVRKARELGIDVPVLQTLYALLVAVNYRMQQQHSA